MARYHAPQPAPTSGAVVTDLLEAVAREGARRMLERALALEIDVLDNPRTHKPKHDRWLARHRNVHFHFTPTHASWLNQVEVWFSILERAALQGSSQTSPRVARAAIERFVAAYHDTATPFGWQQREVHQVSLSHHYAAFRN